MNAQGHISHTSLPDYSERVSKDLYPGKAKEPEGLLIEVLGRLRVSAERIHCERLTLAQISDQTFGSVPQPTGPGDAAVGQTDHLLSRTQEISLALCKLDDEIKHLQSVVSRFNQL